MDEAIEDWLEPNNTDDLYDFAFNPSGWEITRDIIGVIFGIIGFTSNIIIIYMIARNERMRNKTNLLLMNFIINDTFFLLCNVHFWAAIYELCGSQLEWSIEYNCIIGHMDLTFQANESLFLLILVSNTLIKNKRIQIKPLLIVAYTVIALNVIITQICCHFRLFPLLSVLLALIIFINFLVILFKEINNCYKKWHKKDPLSQGTMFRLNIGRIYVGSWLFVFFLYLVSGIQGFNYPIIFILASNCYLCGFYILIYIVHSDKNFKICFLNLIHGKNVGNYDVDATITFAEELSEDCQEHNHVNMSNRA